MQHYDVGVFARSGRCAILVTEGNMPKQPADAQKSNEPETLANEWLIPLLAALIAGLFTLLTVPLDGPVIGWVLFTGVLAVGVALLVPGLCWLRQDTNGRRRGGPLVFAGIIALSLALPALYRIPASLPAKPGEQKPALSNVSPVLASSAVENLRSPPALLGLIYVDAAKIEPRYVSSLIQALHDKK